MLSGEKLCLQWNEFQTNVRTSYQGLRTTEDYSDVTLACEDGSQIKAHRIILSSSSLFFKYLLASLTNDHPLVYMRGLKHQDLSNIIDFIYHGEAEVPKEDLETFLLIAGELGVKGMTKQAKMSERVGGMEEEKFLEESEPIEDHLKVISTEKKNWEVKKDFECDQCGKTYGTRASLRTHIYNHSKKLQAHGAAVKAGELEEKFNTLVEKRDCYTYPCSKCGEIFTTSIALKAHNDKNHPEEAAPKLYNCDICLKSATSKEAVRVHKIRYHPKN